MNSAAAAAPVGKNYHYYTRNEVVELLKQLLQFHPNGLECRTILSIVASRMFGVTKRDLNPILYRAPFKQVGAHKPPRFTVGECAASAAEPRCIGVVSPVRLCGRCSSDKPRTQAACDLRPLSVGQQLPSVRNVHPCRIGARYISPTKRELCGASVTRSSRYIGEAVFAPAVPSCASSTLQIREKDAMSTLNVYSLKTMQRAGTYSTEVSADAPYSCELRYLVDGEYQQRRVHVEGFENKANAREAAAACALNVIDAVRMARHASEFYQRVGEQGRDLRTEFLVWYNSYTTMRGKQFDRCQIVLEGERGYAIAILTYTMLCITDDGNDAIQRKESTTGWAYSTEAAVGCAMGRALQSIIASATTTTTQTIATQAVDPLYGIVESGVSKRCRACSALDFDADDDSSGTGSSSDEMDGAHVHALMESVMNTHPTKAPDTPCCSYLSAHCEDHRQLEPPRAVVQQPNPAGSTSEIHAEKEDDAKKQQDICTLVGSILLDAHAAKQDSTVDAPLDAPQSAAETANAVSTPGAVSAPGDYTLVHKTAVAQLSFLCDILGFQYHYTVLDPYGNISNTKVFVSLVIKCNGLICQTGPSMAGDDSVDEAKNKAARDMLDWMKTRIFDVSKK
jgi:hypothetical protein